jgi:GH24 family phage-related lysozyme (muramidase)
LINEDPNNPKILDEIRTTGLRDRLGNYLRGLQRRRDAEAELYKRGMK